MFASVQSERTDPPPIGRFAPSTTGPAHPGTLLAALLCWLDARSRAGRVALRLEDLDPERSRPAWTAALQADLAWLGLEWDAVCEQHDAHAGHAAALDRLAEQGRLYPCACSRKVLREHAAPGKDGELRYPGTCRGRPLPSAGWRACDEPLRVALPSGRIALRDESGLDLSQDPGAQGVTRVVRGRDLAASTATQVALQDLLGLPRPVYRHRAASRASVRAPRAAAGGAGRPAAEVRAGPGGRPAWRWTPPGRDLAPRA